MIYNKSTNKGFTLVELLAVIVILAIILAIAIPGIGKILDNATRSAFEADAKMLLKSAELKQLENAAFNPLSINETNLEEELNISPINYDKLIIKESNNKLYVTIVGKNRWKDLTVSGTRQMTKSYETINNVVRGVNAPVLAEGMTPIKWNGTTWVSTTEDDEGWYNYDNKIWANAKTTDGSMWVWIPRYIYKITSGWHSNETGTIDVQFSRGVDDTIGGTVVLDTRSTAEASNGNWTNHPAFTFGDTEVTGIWVAKFEATSSEPIGNSTEIDNDINKTVKIIPNVEPWRYITYDNAFIVSRNMENKSVYGWDASGRGIDTHLMKNTEWGSVAYLSKSQYGKNTEEIWNNSFNTFKTGCAGSEEDAKNETLCNEYHTTNGIKASTTGNIYGIYDMSGGAWERMATYVDNGNSNLNAFGKSIIQAESKYKDVYEKGSADDQPNNYNLTINKKGDAVYETSNENSWFDDYSGMPDTSSPWFFRGGYWSNGSSAGIFSFNRTSGFAHSAGGFRPVLLVNSEL